MSSKGKKTIYWTIFCLGTLIWLTGCSEENYKKQADETVYNILDQKWQDDFGSKANYKISDVEPSPHDIKIEKVIPESGILTLPQAVAIATAHNRQYQLEREILYTVALDLKSFRHEFEPWPFSGARGGYGEEGEEKGFGTEADFGFQLLLANGARIGVKIALAWFQVFTGDLSGGLVSVLSPTINVPLLRGSDIRVVMENLTQAERDTLYQIRAFNRYRQMFVVSVISQYYLVLQQYDLFKNAERHYKGLLDLHEQAEKLANAGRLPRHELNQISQNKLQALDEMAIAERDYRQVLDEFKITLSLPVTAEFKPDVNELAALRETAPHSSAFSQITKTQKNLTTEEIAALDEELELLELLENQYNNNNFVFNEDGEFSEKDVIETALALRLDLANKADAIEDARRKVLVAKDSLRGELNLFFGTNATSLSSSSELPGIGALDDDLSTDRNRPDSMRRLRDDNPVRSFEDKSVMGIDLELPLDRVAEQNIYRKALIILNQRQREYEEMVDLVTLEVRQNYRNMTQASERLRVQFNSLKLAQKRFDNTLLLMQYGRANSQRVIDAQEDFFNAQNAVTEAVTNYAIAMLGFYRDTGVLQVKPDGMWKYQ
ncbi:MAG: TolC family protein [Sedimentisphaerales bacterium]|nr:TolC family protein [Sedimentisphaerales bacterium]